MDAALKMDAQYRLQRHIYDLTRKYYLLGRDRILRQIVLQPEDTLLEVGCGTGRNLIRLARRYPDNRFMGVDAATVMLATAAAKLQRNGLQSIQLQQALAQQLSPQLLGRDEAFEHILFSYVLSMIPDWQCAIDVAIANLKPGGQLHVVDFSDQAGLPGWFRRILTTWLAWFHVHPDTSVLNYIEQSVSTLGGELTIEQLSGRYAFIVHYRKPV